MFQNGLRPVVLGCLCYISGIVSQAMVLISGNSFAGERFLALCQDHESHDWGALAASGPSGFRMMF